MDQLDRLDLREIDYAAYFDLVAVSNGVEVFDDYDYAAPVQVHVPSSLTVAAGTEEVPGVVLSPATYTPLGLGLGPDGRVCGKMGTFGRVSVERVRALGVEDLGDDGVHVLHEQMPLWEAWVLAGSLRARRNGNGRVHGWSM
jgi:hypothetical protein